MTSSASRLGALRRLPRQPSRFYAVTDMDTARKVGGLLWIFGALIVAVVMPVAPPTEHAGSPLGWILGASVVTCCLLGAWPLLRTPWKVSPDALVAMGYASLAMVAALEWAGGESSPYGELYIISVIYFSAVHTPRRVLVFMGAVVACLALPFLYGGWDGEHAAQALVHLLLWSALAAAAAVFTAEVRAARMDLMEHEQEASALARRDPLTALGNRRDFDETLDRLVAGARRGDRPLSLVIADVEGFKAVNDSHGHLEGDRCLRAVARAIAASVRPTDHTFRWGGDEFAVLLPGTDRDQAQVAIDRIAGAVALDVASPDQQPLRLRYGVAEIGAGMDAGELIAGADANLLLAKAAEAYSAQ